MRELYNISGFRVTLHDIDCKEIAAYPPERSAFCKWIQQSNPLVRPLCQACDAKAFDKVKKTKKLYIYHCHLGLYEAVAPLYNFGVLSGYLMMGQMLDKSICNQTHVENCASKYVDDKVKLNKLIRQIPTTTEEKISSCIHIMSICADYITLTHRMILKSGNIADEIKKYIGVHYKEKITIELLTKQFMCSKSTLMNSFKKRFGMTINSYIMEIRLEQSTKMLLHSDLPIHQISEQCGFSDQNYFTKVFSRNFKITPTQFRISCKK